MNRVIAYVTGAVGGCLLSGGNAVADNGSAAITKARTVR
jgi:hypothetical protein